MLKRRMYHFMSRLRRYTFLALIPGQPYLQKRAVTEREAIARMSCVDCHIVIVIVIVNDCNGNGNGNGVTVTKQVDVIGLLVRILGP